MPLRILRVLAQRRARHMLKSGPRQTLLPFPEGNWIMTNQEAPAAWRTVMSMVGDTVVMADPVKMTSRCC
jgi:hypothetical protein